MEKKRICTPQVQKFETEHIRQVRKLAAECMVLLKNDGTLPLKETGKLALYGNGARRTIKGGSGSGDVNVRHFVTVEEGLENAGFEITTKSWLQSYDQIIDREKQEYFTGIRKRADSLGANPLMLAIGRMAPEPNYDLPLDGEGDTAVYVLARISGEGSDRLAAPGDIQLTETEIHDILWLSRKYPHFILVLNTGGMVDLKPVESVGTILQMGQLGTPVGDVLADVLCGKAYPSGKLTMTWAPIEDYPSTEGFGDPNDTKYAEGIYVGYRYFDTVGYASAFPFGFGLGYTEFEIIVKDMAADAKTITVTTEIKNIGKAAGKEIVQVYYSAPQGHLDKPYQELAAYVKTKELSPGESETLKISFAVSVMASYDTEHAAYIMEKGIYYIRVGNCSRNTHIAGAVSLDETVIICKVKNICGQTGFEDQKIPFRPITYEGEEQEKKSVKVLEISAAELEMCEIIYSDQAEEILSGPACSWEEVAGGKKTLDEFVGGLTDDQMACICIGNYRETDNPLEVIGNASYTVAGAAGETTGHLEELGLPSLIMADGPAGIRISPEYRIIDGVVKGSASTRGDMFLVYTPEEQQAMFAMAEVSETEENVEMYYHYCTAIPIGTSIAQSWNDEVARECGRIVGEEMEMFDIQVWLAPALNIQRSPFCGRNFEYFSEDPVISGYMAAAITKGVQTFENTETAIKHFACNNQETNRSFSNSLVNERALREVYLKGFEICVKNTAVKYIMTSYNLINGEHVCNRKDLLTAVLRDEWGFDGVVMTDWMVTGGGMGANGQKWPHASAAGNIKAGNDLTMPGTRADKADILNALENKEHPYALNRAELQICTKRVLERILARVYSETICADLTADYTNET